MNFFETRENKKFRNFSLTQGLKGQQCLPKRRLLNRNSGILYASKMYCGFDTMTSNDKT